MLAQCPTLTEWPWYGFLKTKKFCILKKGLKKRGEGHVNSACARAVWVHFLPDIAHTQQYLCAIACCFWICADPTFPSLFFFFSFFSCKNTLPARPLLPVPDRVPRFTEEYLVQLKKKRRRPYPRTNPPISQCYRCATPAL